MAGRTSAGVGVGVAITILGVACLALFILTIVFLSQKQAAERGLATANTDLTEFVTPDERQRDDVRIVLDQAKKGRQSVVGYLQNSLQETMGRVTGSKRDSFEQLGTRLAGVQGADTAPLIQVIRERETQIANLEKQLAQAEDARTTALADLQNEVDRVSNLEESQRNTITELSAQIEGYKQELDSYRGGIEGWRADMDVAIGKVTGEADDERARLGDQIRRIQEENLVLQNQVQRLRDEKNKDILKGADEFALVDGEVVSVTPGDNLAFISRGRRDKIILGMLFTVYSNSTAIRPDERTGEYPRGKATLEVIRFDETSSACRILQEARGNPVVRGDVIANALYDPNKVYKFLVYGNFDINGDGRSTPQGKTDIEAIIKSWNGDVVANMTGDVDFLVLGSRPTLPPEPGVGAPIEIVREYIRQQQIVEEYDRLFKQAEATSVPVLNENRLYTLTGRLGGVSR